MNAVPRIAQFSGHKAPVYALEQGPEPDQFFSAGGDGFVVLWDVNQPEEGRLIAQVSGSVYALSYWPECQLLCIACNFDGLHIIDLNSGLEIWNWPTPGSSWFRMRRLGQQLWLAGSGGKLLSLNASSSEISLKEYQVGQKVLRALDIDLVSGTLVLGNSAGDVYQLDLEGRVQSTIEKAHEGTVFALACFPLGGQRITAGKDAYLRLWDEAISTSAAVKEVPAHLFGIHDIALHPEKPILASGSMDKTVKIWDAQTLKLLRVLDKTRHAGHGHSVNQILWLKHPELLLTCSDDRSITAWNIYN